MVFESLTEANQHIWLLTGFPMLNVVLVGSRFKYPAESRYAPIEGEALAVGDPLDKVRHFGLGCDNLIITVDHSHF